jgi:nicotinamide-nucleotide amidase
MPETDAELTRLAERLGAALTARGWQVTAAESCTGGWIAKAITDVAGSSGWFGAGFVTYSNAAKVDALAVSAADIERHGAVSEAVVRAMAAGARRAAGADLAVAVSGVAGPGGGSADKPVGTVWFAWAGPDGERAERCRFEGGREAVRRATVAHALRGLLAAAAPDARVGARSMTSG